jgi:hypothetical protein
MSSHQIELKLEFFKDMVLRQLMEDPLSYPPGAHYKFPNRLLGASADSRPRVGVLSQELGIQACLRYGLLRHFGPRG